MKLAYAVLLVFPSFVFGQSPTDSLVKQDSLYLRMIIPDRDTLRVMTGRQRIAASTHPNAKAFVNGKELKVYPSGAFVALLQFPVGANPLRIVVQSPAGDSLWREFVVVRPDPPKPLPHEPLAIDVASIEPSQNLWLGRDNILEVRFKGSPGYEASFDIEGVESGIAMIEQSEGVYLGRYGVKETDETREGRIEVRLKKSFWSSEKAFAKGRVSFVPLELPRTVEVKGRRPFLNAGLGEDRLGGAKLGYLQAGVRVQVSGKVGRQYRVQLSEGLIGWLPEDFATVMPLETPLPRSLVGSISATGNSREDIVTISLSEKLPYITDQQVNPAAITVDVFGATSNTNWITHHLSAAGIKTVSWDQVGTDHYRLTIALREEQHWGYDIGYESGSALRVRVRRPPLILNPDSALAGMAIAVDAGHGGENQGAFGATGAREMDVTFATARHLQSILQAKGARVVMTRTDTNGVSMSDRWEVAQQGGAHVLVSIHCNSIGGNSDPETVQGTSTYYRHTGFQPLSDIMYAKMLELGLGQFGVIGSFNFTLNAPTQFPNVLVETAFLSNPEDEMKLIDDGFRKRMAEQIVKGLEEFFNKYGHPVGR
ncbi:MAG: N-acetylmuramoyl-L-alanine amidase [Ignavibacteriales bacterium]|nr:N-acetylmuramoyl-L-alanine amidase [Ignavibacteriales bacterium]